MSRGCTQTSNAAKKRSYRSLGRRKGHISLPEARNISGCLTPAKAVDEEITWTRQSLNHILMSHKRWECCKQPGCEIATLAIWIHPLCSTGTELLWALSSAGMIRWAWLISVVSGSRSNRSELYYGESFPGPWGKFLFQTKKKIKKWKTGETF